MLSRLTLIIDRFTSIPVPFIIAITLPVSVGAGTSGLRGMLWGLVPALFSGVLTYALDRWIKRHRAPSEPAGGGKSMTQVAGSAACLVPGLAVLLVFPAPRPVLACALCLFGILVATAPITRWWDVSFHATTSTGVAAICWLEFGVAAGLPAMALAAVVAWTRVRLYRQTNGNEGHNVPQVVVGALIGASVCGPIYALIT
jgi:hypothetical protein